MTKLNAKLWTVRPGAILAPSLVAHWVGWAWEGRDSNASACTSALAPLTVSITHSQHPSHRLAPPPPQDQALPPSDVYFVDIGANVGWFTHNVAAMGYSVVAFEPTTPNALAIRQTMCDIPLLHSRISLVNKVGAGSEEGRGCRHCLPPEGWLHQQLRACRLHVQPHCCCAAAGPGRKGPALPRVCGCDQRRRRPRQLQPQRTRA